MNPSLKGKTALVTGATSGIGLAAATELAYRGATVLLAGRNPDRGEAARATVAAVATGPEPILFLADLESQDEIRRLAGEIRTAVPVLDVLVNNAGGIFANRELTVDGIERTFALNHLAPFVLTNEVLDLITAAPQGRVITVTSEMHSGRIDFANLQGERSYNFLRMYMATKTANILFAFELARRLAGTSATSNAVSPGPARTRFGDDLTGAAHLFPLLMKNIPLRNRPARRRVIGRAGRRCAQARTSATSAATVGASPGSCRRAFVPSMCR
jgi:retinol dehydrogenase-14